MIRNRSRAGIVGLTGILVFLMGCASTPHRGAPGVQKASLHSIKTRTLSHGQTTPSHPRLQKARQLFERGTEAFENGSLETARTAFDRATEILLGITPDDPVFAEAQSLLMDIMSVSLEVDRQFSGMPDESSSETAFIDMVGDVEVLMSDEDIRRMIRDIREIAKAGDFDIPLVIHPSVIRMIRAYQTVRRREFERGLRRMPRYLALYRSMFKEAGLPSDLAYLALIESGFNARAYSRARARGIWQFIYGTGRKYGLTINWWLDERSDFIRSTEAAIAYIKDLYTEFNDWWLALAAYNAGEGRIRRAIARAGTRDFWKLQDRGALPRETRNYVPAFMAAVLIGKFPERFGFDPPDGEPIAWDEVPIRGGLSLHAISRLTGISEKVLLELNGGLRRRYIPSGVTYPLRVPRGRGVEVAQALVNAPRSRVRDYLVHRIRRGDTLYGIARRYGVSLRLLMDVNHLSKRSILRVGRVIRVPIFNRRSRRAKRRRVVVLKSVATDHYRVKEGDTLYQIAQANGIPWRAILAVNPGLDPRALQPGQVIRIPIKKKGRRVRVSKSPVGTRIHIVRRGDNLYRIARLYGVRLEELMRYNGLTRNSVLYPGNRLIIPPKEGLNHENINSKSR